MDDSGEAHDQLNVEEVVQLPLGPLVSLRELALLAFVGVLISVGVSSWMQGLFGWSECARLRALLFATGGVQLLALGAGVWNVRRRLRKSFLLKVPAGPLDGLAAVAIAREYVKKALDRVAELVVTPVLLFALGVVFGTWAAVWWLGMDHSC
jgi:hypothetical protein